MNTSVLVGGVLVLVVLIAGVVLFTRQAEAPMPLATPETEDMMMDVSLEDDILEATPLASPVTSGVPAVSTTPGAPAVSGAVKSFTVAGSNFKFTPAELRVKQGDTVRITLTNSSAAPHDWRLDEFQAATKLVQPGQQETIEFVASTAGQFEYYCSVGNHRQMGMKGMLIVE